MSKIMREENNTIIELDKVEILKMLEEKGEFTKDGAIIKKWDSEEEGENYIFQIKRNNINYLGVLNYKFDREGYGIHNFENGDKYFGYFGEDKRNKHGFYMWAPTKKNNKVLTECYYGFWKNNKKEKNGMYIWMEEEEKNKDFDNANFDVYLGEIRNEKYARGTYLTKNGEDYYVYHGNFDEDGKKTDECGYFYSAKYDRVFHGKITKDCFESGYMAFFDEDGKINKIIFCTFDKNGDCLKIKNEEYLDQKELEFQKKEIDNFRNIILGVDYFGEIYDKYKKITTFINDEMNSLNIFNDKDKFPKLISLCVAYNSKNIYNDIEKNLFDRK